MDLDIFPGQETDVINDKEITRVGHGYIQGIDRSNQKGPPDISVRFLVESDSTMSFGMAKSARIYRRHMKLPGEEFHQHIITDISQFDQHRAKTLPALPLFFKRPVELLGFEQSFLDQQFP